MIPVKVLRDVRSEKCVQLPNFFLRDALRPGEVIDIRRELDLERSHQLLGIFDRGAKIVRATVRGKRQLLTSFVDVLNGKLIWTYHEPHDEHGHLVAVIATFE